MKYAFLIIAFALSVFSCKKSDSEIVPTSIAGSWKMTRVKDVLTNNVTVKPSSPIKGDVIITFAVDTDTSGTFSGNTPTNTFTGFGIWTNGFVLGPDHFISIPILSMTKVGEPPWGNLFVANIRDAYKYSFESGKKLNIITPKTILAFQKIR